MRVAIAVLLCTVLCACGSQSKKEEEEAKDTYACLLNGERLVVRFEIGEARMLMPSGDRIILYQIPAGSGVRFSNGLLELRGKGTNLNLIENGASTPLEGCQPLIPPKQ